MESTNFKVATIGGAGHIGLPLSCYIQNKNIETVIIDKNKEAIEKILNGSPPFKEDNFEINLKNALDRGLDATTDIEKISDCNVVIVCLGTSSDEKDKKIFDTVIKEILDKINDQSLLILRSTVERGLLEKIIEEIKSIKKNVKTAYCPERLAEGFAFEELSALPQIVGTNDINDYKDFDEFFTMLGISTLSVSINEAEFIKLFLNSYRYSQFSLINKYANIAESLSLDFSRLLEIAEKNYPRLKGVPRPGFVGGPCLIKYHKTFINSYEPNGDFLKKFFVVNENFMDNLINRIKSQFKGNKIIQLGITFKPNSDDLRDSQSLILNKNLTNLGYEIRIVEPNIDGYSSYQEIKNFSDNILISTFHDDFKNLSFNNKEVIIVGSK